MSTSEARQLLRPGLLEAVSVLVAGAPEGARPGSALAPLAPALRGLGAAVAECRPEHPGGGALEEEELELAVEDALGLLGGGAQVLVLDAASLFAAGGRDALVGCLQASWGLIRAIASRAFLSAGGGRVLMIAPAAGAGEHADAAVAALENLARTLSIEWARHGVTAVAVAPGGSTSPAELADVAAYLASSAGAYFSGCLLDLRGGPHGPGGRAF